MLTEIFWATDCRDRGRGTKHMELRRGKALLCVISSGVAYRCCSEWQGCSTLGFLLNSMNWSNSWERGSLISTFKIKSFTIGGKSHFSIGFWQFCSSAMKWTWSYNLNSQVFCGAKLANTFEILTWWKSFFVVQILKITWLNRLMNTHWVERSKQLVRRY